MVSMLCDDGLGFERSKLTHVQAVVLLDLKLRQQLITVVIIKPQ